MEENTQVIIDIPMENLISQLQQLEKQYELNKAALDEYTKAGKGNSNEARRLEQEQKVLKQEMRGVEKQMQDNIKMERAQENSLIQLRARLATLNKQYDSMSGIDRMGKEGQKLQARIKGLSDEILGLEGSTGRWQRNVGNYQSALQGLSTNFRAAGLSTGGLDKALKLLNANPIILFLTAIVTAVTSVVKAMRDNESAMMALREGMAALNPVIDVFSRALDKLAKGVVWVVTKAVEGLTSRIGDLLRVTQAVGNFFGADWHMADNFEAAQEAAKNLQKSENDYIKAKRQWGIESARIDQQVADLREKASDKESHTAEQRLAYLDEAIRLETEKARKEQEFAEWNLKNLQEEAKRSENSAEMNDRLAQAEIEVVRASTNLSNVKRTLNRQRLEAVNATKKQTEATKELNEEIGQLREAYEDITMLSMDALADAAAKKSKKLADDVKKAADSVGLFDEAVQGLAVSDAMSQAFDFPDDVEDGPSKIEEFAAAYARNAEAIEETSQAMGSAFGSVASIYRQMADDESRSEEERAEAAKKARRWSAMQIAANSGTAIAKGIASAMDTPFPGNIAAIATTLAAVLSAITQAKALSAEGFEHGGVVGGFQGATAGPDNTVVTARTGEMFLNASEQRRLFDIANGAAMPSAAAAFSAALRNMPSPVLEYSEFKRFTDNVTSFDETQILK